MKINYAQHVIGEAEYTAVSTLMRESWLARGPALPQFEAAFSSALGCGHSVSCANGSVAIEIVLRALDIGIGDEVIVPNVTWVSTASAVNLVGAVPVFADIQPTSPIICLQSIEEVISAKTKALIVVHFAGVAANMDALSALCEKHDLYLIEDAAHAVGGAYPDGSKIGSSPLSKAATFSFHPAKNITTGEGGMITTQDAALAKRMAIIRSNGVIRRAQDGIDKAKYDCLEIASNYHLNDMAAAIGLCQLERLSDFVKKRAALWNVYKDQLDGVEGVTLVDHPATSAFNLCIILIDRGRDEVLVALNDAGIGAYYHYPLLDELTVYKGREHCIVRSSLARSKDYSNKALTLPLHPSLSEEDVVNVCQTLRDQI